MFTASAAETELQAMCEQCVESIEEADVNIFDNIKWPENIDSVISVAEPIESDPIFNISAEQLAEQTQFNNVMKPGLTYPCSCCHQLFFKQSVVSLSLEKYSGDVADKWLSFIKSMSGLHYVCKRCHSGLRRNQMPPLCTANSLQLSEIPTELSQLNEVGERLVSLTYPFMKIINAPTCNRSKIRGPVVTVPVGVTGVEGALPRTKDSSGIILLQLRRKQEYDHTYLQRFVNPRHLNSAILWLKENNPLYKDVHINKVDDSDEQSVVQDADAQEENEEPQDSRRSNYCFVSAAIDKADPDFFTKQSAIVSLAPAEGLRPVSILSLANKSSLLQECFPKSIPYGDFGFNVLREKPITKAQLMHWCLCNHDPRFAQSADFVFLAQYVREAESLASSIKVQLRKAAAGHVTAGDARQEGFSDEVMLQKLGYRFMSQVRGSPAYWQRVMYDVLAMVRQLGKPTWFVTFSCADLYWHEIIRSIAYQYGTQYTDEEIDALSYTERCNWINRNVVTAVRIADYRFQTMLNNVLYGAVKPLENIVHHFFRAEDQNRCCLHWHGILWTENAPQIGVNSDDEICGFIDKYVTVHVPGDEYSQLHGLVQSRQVHHHTNTCQKKKQIGPASNEDDMCRFHFPKPIAQQTRLERNPLLLDTDAYKSKQITDADIPITVIHKRRDKEEMINAYNPHLLLTWQANLDVQYITNEYAVINYILGYMCKAEKEVAEKIKAALSDALCEVSSRGRLVKMMNAFVKARTWSDHMAAVLATGTKLVYKDVAVIFIPSGLPENRTRMLLPRSRLEQLDAQSDEIFCKNMLDYYADRPRQLESLCLAEFVSQYVVVGQGGKQTENDAEEEDGNVRLPKNKGRLPRFKTLSGAREVRQRRQPAVVRYHHFNKDKQSEQFYYTLMLIYWPWRCETQDLTVAECSAVQLFETRADEIKTKMEAFEKVPDSLIYAAVQSMLQSDGDGEAASKNEGDGKISVKAAMLDYDENLLAQCDILGVVDNDKLVADVDRGVVAEVISDVEYDCIVKSLNTEQQSVFNEILQHATAIRLETNKQQAAQLHVADENRRLTKSRTRPKSLPGEKESMATCRSESAECGASATTQSLYMFVSGPGGVGKSHTIRAIRHMLPRILSEQNPNEPVCIVTATTGAAAEQINGNTINSALGLGKNCDDLKPMSAQVRDLLRVRYRNLKYIILDEVSMLSYKHLCNISERLKEITGRYDFEYGNISVLFFGDLYQLPPVFGSYVFAPGSCSTNHLWRDYVILRELTTVVCQNEKTFIDLLCRVRTGKQNTQDLELLRSRVVSNTDDIDLQNIVHVYATNAKCNMYNQHKLNCLASKENPVIHVCADDSAVTPGVKLHKSLIPTSINSTGGIPEALDICKGARVMLRANLDVSDKLVNGSMGTVIGFVYDRRKLDSAKPTSDANTEALDYILVEFDNTNAGHRARQQFNRNSQKSGNTTIPDSHRATPVARTVVNFIGTNKRTMLKRAMFPLVLAWAYTVHKSQGKSLDAAVVDIGRDGKQQWQSGQVYVALSRVKLLTRLYLCRFDESLIKSDQRVAEEMERLRLHSVSTPKPPVSLFPVDSFVLRSPKPQHEKQVLKRSADKNDTDDSRTKHVRTNDCTGNEKPCKLGSFSSSLYVDVFNWPTALHANQRIEMSVQHVIHQAVLMHHVPVVTPRDGNCLWHAVSINLCGTTELTQRLRESTAATLLNNRQHFESILMQDSFDKLYEDAVCTGHWGNQHHMLALATCLHRDLYQYSTFRRSKQFGQERFHFESDSAEELALRFLSAADGTRQHIKYHPLCDASDQPPIQIILHRQHFSALLRRSVKAVMFLPPTDLLQ